MVFPRSPPQQRLSPLGPRWPADPRVSPVPTVFPCSPGDCSTWPSVALTTRFQEEADTGWFSEACWRGRSPPPLLLTHRTLPPAPSHSSSWQEPRAHPGGPSPLRLRERQAVRLPPARPQLPLLCGSNSPRLVGAPASPEALSELGGQAPAQSADSGCAELEHLTSARHPRLARTTHTSFTLPRGTRLQSARPASGRAPFHPNWAPPSLLCWAPCARAPDPASCSPWPSLAHLEPLHASLSMPGEPLTRPARSRSLLASSRTPPCSFSPSRAVCRPSGCGAAPVGVLSAPSLLSTLELPQETALAGGTEVSRGHALARSIPPGGQESLSGLGAGAARGLRTSSAASAPPPHLLQTSSPV